MCRERRTYACAKRFSWRVDGVAGRLMGVGEEAGDDAAVAAGFSLGRDSTFLSLRGE